MKNKRIFISILFALAVTFGVSAEETFIGTIRTTMGNPVKGVKAYINNDKKKSVKSDNNGEFKFTDIKPTDSIHIDYKKHIYSFAVNGRQDMMLVAGDDNRIFDRENYTGETFHCNLVDYKGNPIRGAIVYVKDPFDYVKTNKDGSLLIDNIRPTDTLHIKYDGDIHDIPVEGNKGMYIKITRKPIFNDEEMANMGAWSLRLKDYNGPYTKMNAKQLEATGLTNIIDVVRYMPGVTVDQDGNISVRGAGRQKRPDYSGFGGVPKNDFGSSVEPLWVIDGVSGADPGIYDVKDVESIILLKDGAMFGSRGAGGVFIITTKGVK